MKIIVIFLFLILSLLLFFYLHKESTPNPAIHTIPTAQFREKIDQDSSKQLVDVRTALEYKRGHLKSSDNINYLVPGFKEKFKFYDKKKPLYIYCRSGHRSSGAAEVLAEEGFTEIYELQGGILEWNKSK